MSAATEATPENGPQNGPKSGPRAWAERNRANIILTIIVGGIAIAVPFVFESGSSQMNNAVLAVAYVVMALGLNIIVGFAGLLDLGYVAFFAIGAYTTGYFGSGFWSNAG